VNQQHSKTSEVVKATLRSNRRRRNAETSMWYMQDIQIYKARQGMVLYTRTAAKVRYNREPGGFSAIRL